jgi:photosystem II stability/assembly factor-like uncharacterized protein
MDSDDEPQSHSSSSRALRAVALGSLSILALAAAGLAYLHPTWSLGKAAAPAATASIAGSRHLAAVDFVSPATGWVVVEHQSHDFVVLHTSDAGETWNRQLAGSAEVIGEYLHFFDASNGVVVVLGTQAALYRTNDGGKTWNTQPLTRAGGYVLSADFVDGSHGWLLAQASTEGEALLRTDDGGVSWSGLGNPVAYSDWAYRVAFTSLNEGWLYTRSNAPYGYKTDDAGRSWRRVPFPAPPGGWLASTGGSVPSGTYLVEPHSTSGAGIVATLTVEGSPSNNQTSDGPSLADSPVRSVRTFDGGGSMTSVYADVSPYSLSFSTTYSRAVGTQVANQFQLSSLDGGISWKEITTPSVFGAVGYFDALNWWWIGPGVQSTSSDAGRTWSPIHSLLVPAPLPESLQIMDGKHIWFGAMVGTAPLVEGTDDGGVTWKTILLPATP